MLGSGGVAYAGPQDDKKRVERQLQETQATLEAATDRAQQAAAQHDAATAALPGAEQAEGDAKGRAIGAEVSARSARRLSDEAKAAWGAANDMYTAAQSDVAQAREQT